MAVELTAEELALAEAAAAKPVGKRTREERRAIAKAGKAKAEADREKLLAGVPKGLYCRLAGRQQKVVDGQARRYRLDALLQPTVNLNVAVAQLHDLIAHNQGHLAALGDQPEADLVAEERRAKLLDLQTSNQIKSLKLRQLAGETIDAAEHAELMAWLTGQLQELGHRLQSRFGPPAGQVLRGFLERMEAELLGKVAAEAAPAKPKRRQRSRKGAK